MLQPKKLSENNVSNVHWIYIFVCYYINNKNAEFKRKSTRNLGCKTKPRERDDIFNIIFTEFSINVKPIQIFYHGILEMLNIAGSNIPMMMYTDNYVIQYLPTVEFQYNKLTLAQTLIFYSFYLCNPMLKISDILNYELC